MTRLTIALFLSCLIAAPLAQRSWADDAAAVAELHVAVKPVPREGGWMARHKKMNERVAQGDVDLIFIGDSITQGWEGKGRPVWEKSYGERKAVNLGIGGDRTQHVIWRLENGNIDGISPKLAVIMIGTNNSGNNSAQETTEGVEAIVARLREKLPKTKILLLAVFPRGETPADAKRQENDKVNAAIAKLDDGEMIHYLNIKDSFLDQDGVLSRTIMPDLLHLTTEGYQIWADSIEASVAKLMQE